MMFFSEPVIVEYLFDPEVLAKIKKASEIANVTLVKNNCISSKEPKQI